MKKRQWIVADRVESDLSQHLLLSRLKNLSLTPDQYLHPKLSDLSSPDAFEGMSLAIERIINAIANHTSIVVWGDFDADGVTSTAIVWETLHELGAEVMPYIPNRDSEGHGFSDVGIQKLVDDGVGLVITVDHGITAIDEVKELGRLGIEVIITDHHEPRIVEFDSREELVLPEAVSIIHPMLMRDSQPLAGCGVAYMLAYAVWLRAKKLKDDDQSRDLFAKQKIELAAIGTIADMVPLLGDNRVIATHGLLSLTTTSRPGLQHMYQLAGIQDKKEFSAYEVGFGIGPRLNAPGRLGDALQSLRLLCTKDSSRASQLAKELDDLNKQRQDLLAKVAEEAKAEVLKHGDGVFVLAKPNWPAGVCGLAAGKVVESFYRPTVVMENMGDLSRGSARSIVGFDFTAALTTIADLLESYGGHAMAAGFVAKTDNLPLIEQKLTELLWTQFDKNNLNPLLHIDAEVGLSELTPDLHTFICQMEPFGMGNPKPILASKSLELISFRGVGGDGKHLKLTLQDNGQNSEGGQADIPSTPHTFDAIAFGFGYLANSLNIGAFVDVAYQLDENVWQNRRSLQLMVKDIRLAEDG